MAHAALVSALQLLHHTINEDHFHNLFSIKQQFQTLCQKFYFLQSFLEDDDSPNNCSLETRIREVAYQAQDIIESQISNPEKLNLGSDPNRRVLKKPSWRLLYAVQKAVSLQNKPHKNVDHSVNNFEKLYQQLQNVMDEVDCIEEEVIKIKQSQKTEIEDLQFNNSSTATISSPRIPKTNMVGFEKDLEEIIDQLSGGSSKLQVVPIVGMGGIGKTTLATNLFHDPSIAYHFHIRAWITITQRYNLREILLSLLSSVTAITEKLSRETEDGLAECLYKSLKGRK